MSNDQRKTLARHEAAITACAESLGGRYGERILAALIPTPGEVMTEASGRVVGAMVEARDRRERIASEQLAALVGAGWESKDRPAYMAVFYADDLIAELNTARASTRPFAWYRPAADGDQEPEFRTTTPPDGHGWLPVPGYAPAGWSR